MNDTEKTYLRGIVCYAIAIACFLSIVSFGQASDTPYTPKQEALLDALIQVESSGRDDAVGDGGKAIGCLQIWQPYWYDATERSGIGGTYKDCYNRAYAKRIVDAYMTRYAKEAWTDPKRFNAEKCARIHNGGPKGHTKQATKKYWNKVDKLLSFVYNTHMKKEMPDNAKFPVPPVDHGFWGPEDWYDWWQMSGGRLDPNPHYENPDPMPPMSFRDSLQMMKFLQNLPDIDLDK